MPTDTAPFDVTVARPFAVTATAGAVPVIGSGPEAIRTVQEFAAGIAAG